MSRPRPWCRLEASESEPDADALMTLAFCFPPLPWLPLMTAAMAAMATTPRQMKQKPIFFSWSS